ncbi:hypothetical protein GOBAR_AA30955 [Gossypium barbadense]|uniref:Uncharacterized protein n=1 Tax=Gossypium barbadense TaxID=3634 RepID=A0A2P5WF68_GOSBA|nr:hypothetical protein GOBAR_AA30955 [Gossypium barbadense]
MVALWKNPKMLPSSELGQAYSVQAVSRLGSFNSVAYFTIGKAFKVFSSTPDLAEGITPESAATELEPLIPHSETQNNPRQETMVQVRRKRRMGAFACK